MIDLSVPHDEEAELAVLGSIIYENDNFQKVIKVIDASSFYLPSCRVVFMAMVRLSEEGKPIDEILIGDYLKSFDADKFKQIGGYSYLGDLVDHAPSSGNVSHYANIISEKSALRDIICSSQDMISKASSYRANPEHIIKDLGERLDAIKPAGSETKGLVKIKKALGSYFNELEEISKSSGKITGVSTGFIEFDKITSGLQKSDLIVLAARPSMGKTAFALNIALNAAKNAVISDNGSIAIFTLEMSRKQIVSRNMAAYGRINSCTLRDGNLTDDDWDKAGMAANDLSKLPIYIDDETMTVPNMLSECRKMKDESGLSLVIIDYAQLIKGAKKTSNRQEEVSSIFRDLKEMAKRLDCPIIALSQLNRSLESRSDKRPMMSDLRESGAIEQDSDLILFIYRDEVYNPESYDRGTAEIIIAKHRNGQIGDFKLKFQGEYFLFSDL